MPALRWRRSTSQWSGSVALKFSLSSGPVVAQYFTMVRLGREGFRRVEQACRDTARWVAQTIAQMGPFELVSDASAIPVFAFRLAEHITDYTVYDISEALRVHGWQVPAYTLPPNLQDTAVLRIVVRNGFGRDLAELLARDLARVTEELAKLGPLPPHAERTAFHH